MSLFLFSKPALYLFADWTDYGRYYNHSGSSTFSIVIACLFLLVICGLLLFECWIKYKKLIQGILIFVLINGVIIFIGKRSDEERELKSNDKYPYKQVKIPSVNHPNSEKDVMQYGNNPQPQLRQKVRTEKQYEICSNCNGSGRIRCNHCNGTGLIEYTCPSCGGIFEKRLVPCNHSNNIWAVESSSYCIYCNNTGYKEEICCKRCNGSGKISVSCDYCDLFNTVPCVDCGGCGGVLRTRQVIFYE